MFEVCVILISRVACAGSSSLGKALLSGLAVASVFENQILQSRLQMSHTAPKVTLPRKRFLSNPIQTLLGQLQHPFHDSKVIFYGEHHLCRTKISKSKFGWKRNLSVVCIILRTTSPSSEILHPSLRCLCPILSSGAGFNAFDV